MKIGDRVEACGRCFEYYNIPLGASGTIIGKPEKYTGYVVAFDGLHNEKSYDGSFYITPSCLKAVTYKAAMTVHEPITYMEYMDAHITEPKTPTNRIDTFLNPALALEYYDKVKGDKTDINCKCNRNTVNPLEIKNVYFNDPVTVVMWNDGTKTIVRCSENDVYDPEKGLAMAIVKKTYGNDNKFHKIFKKWLPDESYAETVSFEEFFTNLKHILFGKE